MVISSISFWRSGLTEVLGRIVDIVGLLEMKEPNGTPERGDAQSGEDFRARPPSHSGHPPAPAGSFSHPKSAAVFALFRSFLIPFIPAPRTSAILLPMPPQLRGRDERSGGGSRMMEGRFHPTARLDNWAR